MAAKKTAKSATKTEPLKTSTAALMHGHNAFGAKYIKPGFAFTPEMDLAFALGYPHYIELVDGHPADDDPMGAGLAFAASETYSARIWPRDIANRAARAFSKLGNPNSNRADLFALSHPVDVAEAQIIINENLFRSRADRLLLLLEALVGPEIVMGSVIGKLEQLTAEQWTAAFLDKTVYVVGFLLLRLPADVAAKCYTQLKSIHECARASNWEADAIDNLDCVVNGAKGAERSAHRYDGVHIGPMHTLHVVDNPEWVAQTILSNGAPKSTLYPDPRPSFLGGEEVLRATCGWWKKYKGDGAHAVFIDRFGSIRSAFVCSAILEMSTKSTARREANAWLATNSAFVDECSRGSNVEAAE